MLLVGMTKNAAGGAALLHGCHHLPLQSRNVRGFLQDACLVKYRNMMVVLLQLLLLLSTIYIPQPLKSQQTCAKNYRQGRRDNSYAKLKRKEVLRERTGRLHNSKVMHPARKKRFVL